MLAAIVQDVRYGLRQLRKSPAFTLVAVLSLGLGIGANTAIFQLVDTIRLKLLPVADPRNLVTVDFARGSMRSGWFSTRSARLTYSQWEEIQRQQQAFDGVLAWSATRFNLAVGGEARYAEGLYVSGSFFRVLGVTPLVGRTIGDEEDSQGCGSPGAVLSHAFWQREFNSDTSVLGRTVTLEGYAIPVIGVMRPEFFGVEVGNRFDVAIPICADRLLASDKKGRMPLRHAWWLSMMGRLKPGWNLDRVNAHLDAISPSIMQATTPPSYKPDMVKRFLGNKLRAAEAGTGVSGLRREYEQPLWVLMATTGLVLLIACANLANLLLARASVREREMAVRLAIGASRATLVRQLLAESLLLALAGAATGILLAQGLSRALVTFLTTSRNPLYVALSLDWRLIGFTAALAMATCLMFGLAPALRATSVHPAAAIRSGGRGTTAGVERFTLRRVLVATQVALCLVLLVGALLFAGTLRNLLTTDAGFRAEGVVGVGIDLSRTQFAPERRQAIFEDLRSRLAGVPGVVSAAQVMLTPVSGGGWNNEVGPDGTRAASSGKESFFNRVGPGYFRTMGISVVAGREFNDRDNAAAAEVAIVNEQFARKFFGRPDVVGRTFRQEAPAGKPEPMFEIIGVVKNTKYYELREEFLPVAYLASAQDTDPGPGANFLLRLQGSPSELVRSVKASVGQVSPSIGLEFRPFSEQLQNSLLRERLMATLSGGFAVLAGLLAMLGLYGVIAYMVARRRNEIGVRIALGAGRGNVLRLVLRETAMLLTVGLAAGIALALWGGRAAASLLYGMKPYDPASIAIAAAVLTATALAATYGPARRAASLDPMAALREE